MKKILRVVLSLSAVSIASLTSLVTIACSNSLVDPYVAMYKNYFNDTDPNNPYFNFLNSAKVITDSSVSNDENQKFNALYDDGTASKTWDNISSLETDLTTKPLSDTVTLNIDWASMYSEVGLNPVDTNTALTQQLRFYNILAKLYQKDNVLKLLQWVRPSSQQEGNVVAYNEYYPGVNSQTQTYGPMFADKGIIDNQYLTGFWSSDQLTTVSTHEYGHALSNFFGASSSQRNRFNTTYIDIHSFNANMKLNSRLVTSSFTDRTQVLIDFLDQDAVDQGIITLNDDVEKFFFALLVVGSGYSQSAWKDNNINERDEFFAESFAYWMLTPENLRDVGWGLLNDFFIDYVPSFYNL